MKSNEPLKPIFRVEYKNYEGQTISCSVFFRCKEDAMEFANAFGYIDCIPYIHRYYIK